MPSQLLCTLLFNLPKACTPPRYASTSVSCLLCTPSSFRNIIYHGLGSKISILATPCYLLEAQPFFPYLCNPLASLPPTSSLPSTMPRTPLRSLLQEFLILQECIPSSWCFNVHPRHRWLSLITMVLKDGFLPLQQKQ